MPSIRRPALLLSAAVLGTAALGYEPALLRDAAFEAHGTRLSIGTARVPLWGAALAQTREIALENVTLAQGNSTYTAKRIVFSGVASSRAEIEAIFDKSSSEPLAARLNRINVKQITIPELLVEAQFGPHRQRTAYRNVVASEIAQGRIASITIDEGTVEREGPSEGRSTHKKLTITGLAAADIARIYVEKAGPQPAPLTKVYDTFTLDDLRHSGPNDASLRLARMSGRDVLMRPTEESWSGAGSLMAAMAEMDKPSEAETNRLIAASADMLGAFEIGLLEGHGLELEAKSKEGDPIGFRLSRIAYTGAAGKPADLRLEGFNFTAKEGTARFATLAFTGFSFRSTVEGIKALKGKSLQSLDITAMRTLLPTIGTMRFSGLDIDMPDKRRGKEPKTERIRFTAKDIELTADNPINGIPTNIKIGFQNLAMPLPADSKEDGIKELTDLGYKAIDVSFAAAANWNEAAKEIVLREVSFTGADMAHLKITGVIGNVTRDMFDANTGRAMAAALGATAKNLDMTVENTGLFERHLAQEAKKQGKTSEALRQEYGSMAALAIPAILGDSEQTKALAQAVTRFAAKPARLRVAARAKSAEGLGIISLVGISKPAELLERLEINAAADERL